MIDIDLGFSKPRGQTRVVAAMSGGVDSSVAAGLLKRAGYETIGITLQLYDAGEIAKKKVRAAPGRIFTMRAALPNIWVSRTTCSTMSPASSRA